jgi:hypothetical protein
MKTRLQDVLWWQKKYWPVQLTIGKPAQLTATSSFTAARQALLSSLSKLKSKDIDNRTFAQIPLEYMHDFC